MLLAQAGSIVEGAGEWAMQRSGTSEHENQAGPDGRTERSGVFVVGVAENGCPMEKGLAQAVGLPTWCSTWNIFGQKNGFVLVML